MIIGTIALITLGDFWGMSENLRLSEVVRVLPKGLSGGFMI